MGFIYSSQRNKVSRTYLPKLSGRRDYLSLAGTSLFFDSRGANFSMSTGLRYGSVLGGFFSSFSFGRFGLFSKPPPQLGQTLCNTSVTQSLQKVHSKVQIIASVLWLGRPLPQFSQTGLNSNMGFDFDPQVVCFRQRAKP
jgi:hypothetical protein